MEDTNDTEFIKIQLEEDSREILTVERKFTEKVSYIAIIVI